jgi:hypothetical protein
MRPRDVRGRASGGFLFSRADTEKTYLHATAAAVLGLEGMHVLFLSWSDQAGRERG